MPDAPTPPTTVNPALAPRVARFLAASGAYTVLHVAVALVWLLAFGNERSGLVVPIAALLFGLADPAHDRSIARGIAWVTAAIVLGTALMVVGLFIIGWVPTLRAPLQDLPMGARLTGLFLGQAIPGVFAGLMGFGIRSLVGSDQDD